MAAESVQGKDYNGFVIEATPASLSSHKGLFSKDTARSSQRTGESLAIHDAPLFSRRPAGRRWPPGSTSNDAPKYRIQQGQGDHYRSIAQEFNPFINYSASASTIELHPTRDGYEQGSEEALFNFWTINSLPLGVHNRMDLLRNGVRSDLGYSGPSESLDEPDGRTDERTSGAIHQNHSAASTTKPTPTMGPLPWFTDSYQMDSPQRIMVENLIEKINDDTRPLTLQKLASDLQALGRATLLRWGLPLMFVDAPVNQEDTIGTGLDVLISTLPHSTNKQWAGTLADLLLEGDMLKYVDRSNVGCLYQHITVPNPPTWSTRAQSKKGGRLELMAEEKRLRKASTISFEQWRTSTRRFRLQLAMARVTGVMPDGQDYMMFMRHCQRAGRLQELEMTFHHYMDFHPNAPGHMSSERQRSHEDFAKEPEIETEQVFREYIKSLVRQGRMEHAQDVFNGMKRSGVVPSNTTFGVLIDGYGRNLNLKMLRYTLKELFASGREPTVEIYTSLMSNYIRAGELKRADQVYRHLQSRNNLRMDAQCRNVVDNLIRLRGGLIPPRTDLNVALDGDPDDDLFALKEKSKKKQNDIIHHNHRLKRYVDAMNMPQFVTVYKQLAKSGLRPNTVTYNILQDALSSCGQLEDGLLVLEHMKRSQEAQPDVVTFSTLINSAVREKDANTGWGLYGEMREHSIDPTIHTYVTLFDLISLDPSTKVGRAITRHHFIRGGHRVRFPVKTSMEDTIGLLFASELYSQLLNQGLEPNQHVFCSLLNLAVSHGFMELSQHVYREMLYRNVQPNTAILTTLIKGFAIRKDFESGWRVWEHMLENNIPRNVVTYHHLVRLCKRSLQALAEEEDEKPQEVPLRQEQPKQVKQTMQSRKQQPHDPKEHQRSSPPSPLGPAPQLLQEGDAKVKTEPTLHAEEEPSKATKLTKKEKRERQKGERALQQKSKELDDRAKLAEMALEMIREQMQHDQVHWSRLLQFRRREKNRKVWHPIVHETGPLVAVLDEGLSSAWSMEPKKVHGTDPKEEARDRPVGLLETAWTDPDAAVMIKTIFTGGGDRFVPKRSPSRSLTLKWDPEAKMPILLKDWLKKHENKDNKAAVSGRQAQIPKPPVAEIGGSSRCASAIASAE
ncbi:hypothetical protein BGX34_002482 [Mortierella sp. NVP85]|nr:hypothetical protein BGX34_002482 [Mortierella sp. NVP85]